MSQAAQRETALPASMAGVGEIDPYPFYDAVRARGRLVWDDFMRGFLVTSYEDCRYIETNEQLFRHPYADASPELVRIKGGPKVVTIMQPPGHAKMHKFLVRLFSPKAVDIYRRLHVKPILEATLDKALSKDKVDLAAEIGDLLPPRVLMSLFAMDWHDEALVRRVLSLHDTVFAWIGAQCPKGELQENADRAAAEINEMLLPYIRMRRDNPGEDLISLIWTEGRDELGVVTEEDALAICRELFLAGTDTSVHAIANALYILLTQPDVQAKVRADRGRSLSHFVEEVLRLYGSVQYRFRLANKDCEIGGVAVKAGQALILVNSAANRDPVKYAHPDDVDLDRPLPRDHLAFNAGPRTCIGAALARAEMVDTIDMLLDRVPSLRLDPDAPPPVFRFHYTRSFRPMNVRL